MSQTDVVIGAAGALGSAIVRKLVADGKPVRAVVRDVERARRVLPPSADIVVGDAAGAANVRLVCRDAAVIYHCVNVPYQYRATVMPGITDNILAAARESRARLVFPGNVYGYGPFRTLPATEDHPLAATSKKGQLRNAIERKLIDAYLMGDAKVVIPRFPDFYGPNVTNRLMAPIFEAALAGRTASWPGSLDVPHDLIYVEDAAAACCLLGATDSAYGQVWHVPGAGPLTGKQLIDKAFHAAGTEPKARAMGRGFILFRGINSPAVRELLELAQDYAKPLVMDGAKFAAAFPTFQYTSHEEAISQTGHWFGQHLSVRR